MNGFARSTAFSLWHKAEGADLIVPILKRSGQMGCIAVQAKNKEVGFFYGQQQYTNKLLVSRMPFLNFGACGDFAELDPDSNIIRIVAQFGPKNRPVPRDGSWRIAKIADTNLPVLWLDGLNAFDHLFKSPNDTAPLSSGAATTSVTVMINVYDVKPTTDTYSGILSDLNSII